MQNTPAKTHPINDAMRSIAVEEAKRLLDVAMSDTLRIEYLAEIQAEEVEHEHHSGFIPFTDGGGVAYSYHGPAEILYNIDTPDSLNEMIRFHLGDYINGEIDLDEEDEYIVQSKLTIHLYDIDNDRGGFFEKSNSCYIEFAFNFEYPYFRRALPAWCRASMPSEWRVSVEFPFHSINALKHGIATHGDSLVKEKIKQASVENEAK